MEDVRSNGLPGARGSGGEGGGGDGDILLIGHGVGSSSTSLPHQIQLKLDQIHNSILIYKYVMDFFLNLIARVRDIMKRQKGSSSVTKNPPSSNRRRRGPRKPSKGNSGDSSSNNNNNDDKKGEEKEIDPKDKVFAVDAFWKLIGEFVNLSDLKSLRLVSKEFNKSVLNQTDFLDRTVMNLIACDTAKRATTVKYKYFKITLTTNANKRRNNNKNNRAELSWLYPQLKMAQSIIIQDKSNFTGNREDFNRLLSASDCLQNLTVGTNVLVSISSLYRREKLLTKVKTNLQNLKELHLLNQTRIRNISCDDYNKSLYLLVPLLKNVQNIFVGDLFGLSCPKYVEDGKKMEHFSKCQNFDTYTHSIKMLIYQNKKKINSLHIKNPYFWHQVKETEKEEEEETTTKKNKNKSIMDMNFPQLKPLQLHSYSYQNKDVIPFIARHLSNLEELDIIIEDTCPQQLFKEMEKNVGGKLKRLRIKTKNFEDEGDEKWTVLKKCTGLVDFQLDIIPSNIHTYNPDTHHVIISCLPSSIRKISLKNLDGNIGSPFNSLDSSDFEGIRDKRTNKHLLTHLTLRGISNAIDDDTMEFICKEMRLLCHLDICGSSEELTDFGTTGLKLKRKTDDINSSECSLKDMKGLKSLGFSCGKLTNRTLFDAIAFPELGFLELDFTTPKKGDVFSSKAICSVLKNNPSLESILTPSLCYFYDDQFPSRAKMTSFNPRIREHIIVKDYDVRKLRNENKSSCPENHVCDSDDDDDEECGMFSGLPFFFFPFF